MFRISYLPEALARVNDAAVEGVEQEVTRTSAALVAPILGIRLCARFRNDFIRGRAFEQVDQLEQFGKTGVIYGFFREKV